VQWTAKQDGLLLKSREAQAISSEKKRRVVKLASILILECIVLFAVSEGIARLLLPSGPNFIHPQMLIEPSMSRGFTHRPNQHAYTIDKPFVTNSLGLRDEREVPLAKGGEFRIVVLGDSMTVGLGVLSEDTFARQLEKSLNQRFDRVRALNGAVGAYSTWQEVDLLKEKIHQLQPDIVLLAFYWNDLYTKPRQVTPIAISDSGEQHDAALKYLRLLKRSALLLFLRERYEILRLKISPSFDWSHQEMIYEGGTSLYLEQAYEDVSESLEQLKALGDRHGFIPVVIILPIPGQIHRLNSPTYMQQRIHMITEKIGLRTVDMLQPLQQAYALQHDLVIPWDNSHYSAQGHKVVAETIEQYLSAKGLLPSLVNRNSVGTIDPMRGETR
jgi:lysophospholipase L1-like esterase